jgi:hypothetical protein
LELELALSTSTIARRKWWKRKTRGDVYTRKECRDVIKTRGYIPKEWEREREREREGELSRK